MILKHYMISIQNNLKNALKGFSINMLHSYQRTDEGTDGPTEPGVESRARD